MSAFLEDMEARLADEAETFTSAEVRQLIDELMGLAAANTTSVQAAHEEAQAKLQAIRAKYARSNDVQD